MVIFGGSFALDAQPYRALSSTPPHARTDCKPDLHLRIVPGDRILVPPALFKSSAGASIPVRRYRDTKVDDVGLVNLEYFQSFGSPQRIYVDAVASVDSSNDSRPGFLHFRTKDQLWIVKNPMPDSRKTRRSKPENSPFAVKMANLRTGEIGWVLTNDLCLYPQMKVKAGRPVYITFDGEKTNTARPGDIFTVAGETRELPSAMRAGIGDELRNIANPIIVFGINHRTKRYGSIMWQSLEVIPPDEMDNRLRAIPMSLSAHGHAHSPIVRTPEPSPSIYELMPYPRDSYSAMSSLSSDEFEDDEDEDEGEQETLGYGPGWRFGEVSLELQRKRWVAPCPEWRKQDLEHAQRVYESRSRNLSE